MRVRADSVFISSVLFTIALLCLVPTFWAQVLTERDKVWLAKLDVGFRAEATTMSDLAVTCLAIILVGLIVTWMGYIKRVRWTWVVMFVLVWAWAFPLLVVPLLRGTLTVRFPELLYSAVHQSGSPRIWVESVLIFLLMVIALFLPIKSFFLVRKIGEPSRRPSPRLIGGIAATILLIVIALSAWIRLSVYEISPAELNSWQQLPPPPPPPPPPPHTILDSSP